MALFAQTTLDDAEVIRTSDSGLLIEWSEHGEVWIPRRCCLEGQYLDVGDTDIIVATWWLEKEGYL